MTERPNYSKKDCKLFSNIREVR